MFETYNVTMPSQWMSLILWSQIKVEKNCKTKSVYSCGVNDMQEEEQIQKQIKSWQKLGKTREDERPEEAAAPT